MANALEQLRARAAERKKQEELLSGSDLLGTPKTQTKTDTSGSNLLGTPKTTSTTSTIKQRITEQNKVAAGDTDFLYKDMPTPIAGKQASGTMKGDTSNTAFGKGITGTPDYSVDDKGLDNQFGFDKTADPTAYDPSDTSPTVNVLEGMGEGGYDTFFSHVVKSSQMGDLNIDPLFADQLRKEYEPLFAQAQGDPNRLNQLATSLSTALANTFEHQKVLNKLDYDKNAILTQFSNGEEVAAKLDQLKKLIESGETDVDKLASAMGMSRNDILRSQQGDYSGFGADLTGPARDEAAEDIELAMERLDEDYNTQNAQLERRLNELMADETEALNRAERQAEITEINMNKLAGLTGIGFSSLGATGLAEAHQQTRDFMDDIRKNYGRAQRGTKDALEKLTTDYARQSEDYRKGLQDRIEAVSNSFFTNVQAIKDRYGEVSTSAIAALGEASMKYQQQMHTQRRDYAESHRQDIATLNSMKDQLMQEDQFLREQELLDVQDFVNESLNSTYGDIVSAVERGEYTPEYGKKLMTGMQRSIVASLDQAAGQDGIGNVFAQEITQMLNKNMTPAQIMEEIMTGDEFKKYAPSTSFSVAGGYFTQKFGEDPVFQSTAEMKAQSRQLSNIAQDEAMREYGTSPAVRNFNPGNITDLARGGKRVEGERFTVFDTPKEGWNALLNKVQYNQNNPESAYYGSTIQEYFNRYAPASDGNDPVAYAQSVASALGVDVNTPIADVDYYAFAEQIARMEDGNSYKMLQDLGLVGGQTQKALTAEGQDMDFDYLLDNYTIEELNRLSDIAGLNSNQRINYFEENPEMESEYANYSAIQNKIDANSTVPLTYRMAVWHDIPNRQKDNVMEREQINEQIQKMYDMGISEEEAPLVYSAFKIANDEDRDFGMELVNIHKINAEEGIVQQKVKNLGSFVNNGEYENAVALIENDLIAKMDERAVRSNAPTEPKAMAVVSKMQRTVDVINELTAADVGLVGGSIQNLLGKMKGPEATYLKALLTDGNMEKMVEYIGADMTEGEVRNLMPVMPQLNDTVENLLAKLQQIQDNTMEKHNSVRRSFYLPLLTPDQLVNGAAGKTEAYINAMQLSEDTLGQGDMYRITQALLNEQETDDYSDQDFEGTIRSD